MRSLSSRIGLICLLTLLTASASLQGQQRSKARQSTVKIKSPGKGVFTDASTSATRRGYIATVEAGTDGALAVSLATQKRGREKVSYRGRFCSQMRKDSIIYDLVTKAMLNALPVELSVQRCIRSIKLSREP